MAVNFFFVLSGFLITTLMIHEIQNSSRGELSIKKFYMRRIFRIWPPYYVCLGISWLLIPMFTWTYPFRGQPHDELGYVFYLILLPNVAPWFGGVAHGINHLWSIGVEEQFYLLWPWLMKNLNKALRSILLMIGFFVLLKISLRLCLEMQWLDREPYVLSIRFLQSVRIQCMAIGALGAYLWAFHPSYIKPLLSRWVQMVVMLFCVFSLGFHVHYPMFNDEVYCCAFLVVVLNASLSPKSMFSIDHVIFKVLGNVSYGMYLYHMLVVHLFFNTVQVLGVELKESYGFQHMTILSLTVLISMISYYGLEKPILRFKDKYYRVVV